MEKRRHVPRATNDQAEGPLVRIHILNLTPISMNYIFSNPSYRFSVSLDSVALSGIVDLDVHPNFPEHSNRLLDCKAVNLEYPWIHQHVKPYLEYVDDYGYAKEARLNPLKKLLEKDLSLFDDGSDEKIVVEILLIL